ncbi:MAG TPA: gliding motility protein GldL [Paludibacter sp.]|jgi:gliding motility-associated protein GldL|nr:gliding motility protein GldL [Paludibacter sp.]HOS45314.1 gliding motility protein GldL [Paludibacter sp.]HPM09044.1 gliding motility protein GldL [Paludibacter sp.]
MVDKLKKIGSVKIPTKDKLFNVGYGVGASIVIIGVLFKLMYWQGANIMLTVGLVTEALVFFMSAFEKPLKTYEWDKVIDFESGKLDLRIDPRSFVPPAPSSSDDVPTQHFPSATPPVHYPQAPAFPGVTNIEGLSDEDAQKLNMSIQNLARTASQLNEIASFSLETEKLTQSIQAFSENTAKYVQNQEALFKATDILLQLYERIGEDTEKIEVNTQEYRNKVEKINSNLAGMNSIYEIQLKDVHTQSVHFHNQAEISKQLSDEMKNVTGEMSKLKNVSDDFSSATEKLKTNANELADNIAKLNSIYGNMLNSMG